MIARSVRTVLFLLAGLLAAAGPAPAAEMPRAAVFAADDGWGTGRFLSRFRSRSGVVQLCVVAMALGLFILMRKLADPPAGAPRSPTPPRGSDRPPSCWED